MITADLLRVADVTVTGVDIDELDTALTTGPRHGRDLARAAARIEFTAAGTAEPRQLPVPIGYALAMAAATGAPVRVADQLMDQFAVPAQGDLVDQFTRDVSLPRRRRGLRRRSTGTRRSARRLAKDRCAPRRSVRPGTGRAGPHLDPFLFRQLASGRTDIGELGEVLLTRRAGREQDEHPCCAPLWLEKA